MSKKDKTKYKNQYNKENYARIGLYVDKRKKEEIKDRAEMMDVSINAYINMLIDADLQDLKETCDRAVELLNELDKGE